MKQLDVPSDMKIKIDFADNNLPESVRKFQPLLFKDGDSYCCVLGPDPQEGVFGCGKTPLAALKDWDKSLKQRMKLNDKNDEVALFIHRITDPGKDQQQ